MYFVKLGGRFYKYGDAVRLVYLLLSKFKFMSLLRRSIFFLFNNPTTNLSLKPYRLIIKGKFGRLPILAFILWSDVTL